MLREPLFTRRANLVARLSLALIALLLVAVVLVGYGYSYSEYNSDVGRPVAQPVPFSHQHHVAGLGIDCRLCHATAQHSAFAGMPTTDTCMTCHWQIWTNAELLEPLRASWRTGQPIAWNRVHNLPDFAYFNHAVHVNNGIGCETCHGRVDQMPLIWKAESLFMEWCLACHRDPRLFLRPAEEIYTMGWSPPADDPQLGDRLLEAYAIPTERLTDCSVCHR